MGEGSTTNMLFFIIVSLCFSVCTLLRLLRLPILTFQSLPFDAIPSCHLSLSTSRPESEPQILIPGLIFYHDTCAVESPLPSSQAASYLYLGLYQMMARFTDEPKNASASEYTINLPTAHCPRARVSLGQVRLNLLALD